MNKIIFFGLGILSLIYFGYVHFENQQQDEARQVVIQDALRHNKEIKANFQYNYVKDLKRDEILNKSFQSIFAKPLDPTDKRLSKYKNYTNIIYNKSKVYRWSKSHLSYYIEPDAKRRMNSSLIKKAFRHWERKAKIFSFSETNSANKADIYISLAKTSAHNHLAEAGPDQITKGKTFVLPRSNRTIQEYIITHANVILSEDHFTFESMKKYVKAKKDTPFQTLVHEFGHVLGILEHSPKQGDCMYFQADRNGTGCDVMTADTNTLAMVYGRPLSLKRGYYDAGIKVKY